MNEWMDGWMSEWNTAPWSADWAGDSFGKEKNCFKSGLVMMEEIPSGIYSP